MWYNLGVRYRKEIFKYSNGVYDNEKFQNRWLMVFDDGYCA